MMKRNNRGFTLIELIMVIVIMGILAAVVVPKFFSFTTEAHNANKESTLGALRAGLNLYAANQLVTTGSRAYPDGGDVFEADLDFSSILDEEPDGWTVTAGSAADDSAYFIYEAGTSDQKTYVYFSAGGSTYSLGDPQ